MSGTTKSPAKKAVAKRTAPIGPVEAVSEPQPVSKEVQMLLDIEQQRLEIATMQGQLGYLTGRISELVQENHALREGQS